MKFLLLPLLAFIILSSCSGEPDYANNTFQQLITDLKTAIENKDFPEKSLISFEEFKTISTKGQRFKMSDEKIKKRVQAIQKEQKKDFLRLLRELPQDFVFIESDSIGGIVRDVHFIDVALIYDSSENYKKKYLKEKTKNNPDLLKKVCVFEMIENNNKYKLIDDIFVFNIDQWNKHIERKKKEIKRNKK